MSAPAARAAGRRAKDPFTDDGWTRDQLPADAPADSFVMRHPERQVVVLHSATDGASLLQRLGLQQHFPAAAEWSDVVSSYNAAVRGHDDGLVALDKNESASGFRTWQDRLEVWKTAHDDIRIRDVPLKGVWLASFRGALCFLHYLTTRGGSVPASQSALAQQAAHIVLQDWCAEPPANVLKRLLLAGSKGSADKFQKCYKKCHEAFDKLRLSWWPPQWANHQGPDEPAALPVQSPSLPLCADVRELKSEEALAETLNAKVFGQPLAVRHTVSAVWHRITGVANPGMPTVVAFAGPSGHGKTHLGTQLALALFGRDLDPEQLNRVFLYFSVASLTDKSSISTLLGAAQGLNQSENPGALVTFLKHQQESLTPAHADSNLHWIVFLDEVDRSYSTLLEDLRNWFDQGQIRSGFGELFDAKKGLIILGTNVGAGVTIRQKDGSERKSTENCLSQPMPNTAEELAELRERVKSALLNDLCHGQAPTSGRIPYLALFYKFGSDEFEKALCQHLHTTVKQRLADVKGVDVPPNLEIRFDASVLAWLFPFYNDQTGFRSLEYQLTTITAECRKLLQSHRLQAQCRAQSPRAVVVNASISNHYMYFEDKNKNRFKDSSDSPKELSKSKSGSPPPPPPRAQVRVVRTRLEEANFLKSNAPPTAAAAAAASASAAAAAAVASTDHGGLPLAAATVADDVAASGVLTALHVAAAPSAAQKRHPLQDSARIVAAINELGPAHLGASNKQFRKKVEGHLLENSILRASADGLTTTTDGTWKKAIRLSMFKCARRPGGDTTYFIGPKGSKAKRKETSSAATEPRTRSKRAKLARGPDTPQERSSDSGSE